LIIAPCEGDDPYPSKDTRWPVNGDPGSNENDAAGGATTEIRWGVEVVLLPLLSVTVNDTVYVPGLVYVCCGCAPEVVSTGEPSPKFHAYPLLGIVPSASLAVAANDTARPVAGLAGDDVNDATGGRSETVTAPVLA
jgi:hypothetical protein